jgi:hypothetical protein
MMLLQGAGAEALAVRLDMVLSEGRRLGGLEAVITTPFSQLRPLSVSFHESKGGRALRRDVPFEPPLVTSLRDFVAFGSRTAASSSMA